MTTQQNTPERSRAKLIEVKVFTEDVLANVQRLLAQYTSNRSDFMRYTLTTIINSDTSHLFFLCPEKDNDEESLKEVWGMATINVCQTCSSPRAWIDDFVVDEKFRNCGLAHTMLDQILKFAHYVGMPRVMLTVSDIRTEGIKFCHNFGMKKHETNVFVYPLSWGNKGI